MSQVALRIPEQATGSHQGLTQRLNWFDALKRNSQLIFLSKLLLDITKVHKTHNLKTIKYK